MMRRLIALALAAVVAGVSPAHAWLAQKGGAAATPTYQVFLGGITNTTSAGADRNLPFVYTGAAIVTNSSAKGWVFPVSGTITALKVRVNTAPTGAMTHVVTIQVAPAGGTLSNTAATCTITSASSQICDWTGSVAVSAGDMPYVLHHPTNSATATTLSYSVVFQPTTANDTVMSSAPQSGSFTFSTSAAQAIVPFSGQTPAAISSTARRNGLVPDGGTIDKLRVGSVAPGAAASGKQYVYQAYKNGASQTPSCTILETATWCIDGSNSFSVAAGDDVEFQATPTGTPTASDAAIGVRYVPTTAGHYPINLSSSSSPSTGATNWWQVQGGNGTGTSVAEANVQGVSHAQTFKSMRVKVYSSPGAGKSIAFTLRQNGADTGLACTISNTNTTCSVTATVSVADNDLLDLQTVPTGTPTTSAFGVSFLATH